MPDPKEIQSRRDRLSPEQRALLARRIARAGERTAPAAILRRDPTRPAPLSYAQQRLWYLHQWDPTSAAYAVPAAVRVTGQLDTNALESAIRELLARHEALRTVFADDEGRGYQRVLEPPEHALALNDLAAAADPFAEALRQIHEKAARPFDLARGPLFEATLYRCAPEDHLLLLLMHHIVADGWSIGVMMEEVTKLYEAFRSGEPSPLAPLTLQYPDYAAWQREWLSGPALETQMQYWRRQLENVPAVLDLPIAHPRPPSPSYRGKRVPLVLDADLTRALNAFAKAENATPFMLLLAAFAAVLSRYSGQHDITIGSPVANRPQRELEALIGMFVNTLALRLRLDGNPTFREAVGRARDTSLGAFEHQDVPFEKLVDEIQPVRELNHPPLFQVMFALQNAPMPAVHLGDAHLAPIEIDTGTAKFDLTLNLAPVGDTLRGMIEYDAELFDSATIARMAGHLTTFLAGALQRPDTPVAELPLLTPQEQSLLEQWNDTSADYPLDATLHRMFEAQVARTPRNVAVFYEGAALTYDDLNTRANQLARRLRREGVTPGSLVGLCVERSLEMVVGIFGVLKAGGAYVPMDPSYPEDRLAHMARDSQAPVILVSRQTRPLVENQGVTLLCLDTHWPDIAMEDGGNLDSGATAADPAYVIYTSGSTGVPKGAVIPHRAICNHMYWMQDVFPLDANGKVLQKTPFSFDASVWEFYAALFVGGTLVMAVPGGHQDMPYMVRTLREQRITTLQLVPSLLRMLVDQPGLEQCTALENIFCGGEVLTTELRDHLARRLPAPLTNLYGPTECTIDATYHTCTGQYRQRAVPIGRPVANSKVYVLDANMQRVPVGVPGELYIGGRCVGLGYHNRPELTAEKFIPDPFSGEPGARLYKTGDLVRWLPEGELDFLGRIDLQVKLRGFRIELGEVEAALRRCPEIKEAVATVREDSPGRQQLVAYVVAQPGASPEENRLRATLRRSLPEYMVPAAIVLLPALPMTPNNKVDRKKLPPPEHVEDDGLNYVPPTTPAERTLATVWAEVLNLQQVGIRDNFFALGGDSILSIQVIARCAERGIKLTPKQFFQYQTIEELAAVAGEAVKPASDQGVVTGDVPLTPIQRRFFARNLPRPHHWNQAVMLETPKRLDAALLQDTVARLLHHHDALRARFGREDGEWRQHIVPPAGDAPVSFYDLSSSENAAAALTAAAADLQASLDLENGPLLRVALFHVGDDTPDRLLFIAHHLVIDAVSWRVLLDDFARVYEQLERGKEPILPAKTTSWREWGEKVAAHAASAAPLAETVYWTWQKPPAPLPVDCHDGENCEASEECVEEALSAEETTILLTSAPERLHAQPQDLMLAALVQTLARWTNAPAVSVDLEGHGRQEWLEGTDLSRTVGWFTAIYPVTFAAKPGLAPHEALRAVKDALHDVPSFGANYNVLRYMTESAVLADRPAPELGFNYLGRMDSGAHERFSLATGQFGPTRDPGAPREHLLEVVAKVSGERFVVQWLFSRNRHRGETLSRLAQQYMDALRALMRVAPEDTVAPHVADFPLATVGQAALDKLAAKFGKPKPAGDHSGG